MKTIRNLECIHDSRKSFYGKARIEQEENCIELVSYNTPIVSIDNGIITPLWMGYSVTTARHIKEFFKQLYNVDVNKKTFEKIQAGAITTINELM